MWGSVQTRKLLAYRNLHALWQAVNRNPLQQIVFTPIKYVNAHIYTVFTTRDHIFFYSCHSMYPCIWYIHQMGVDYVKCQSWFYFIDFQHTKPKKGIPFEVLISINVTVDWCVNT
jgi:hypothetical protein